MKSRLPRSVLLALGLTAGCDRCSRPHVGPCLEVPPEAEAEPAPERPIRVGPCLKIAPPPPEPEPEPVPVPADTGLQPCLEFAPEPAQPPTPTPEGGEQGALDAPRQKVLARGVLPEDVAALLRKRQG